MPAQSLSLLSKSTVFPDETSTLPDLKLSVSDLPMLSCHYIQKGCLFTRPQTPILDLISLLKRGLAKALSHFPALAGRLTTDEHGYVYITCNDAGADFIHANADYIYIRDVLSPVHVPDCVKDFFSLDRTVSYDGHFKPLLAVQVTELADGIFIGCSVNHAVTDGTSYWNFFNTFAEMCRGVKMISKSPCFDRDSVLISPAVLLVPVGGPKVTFDVSSPIRERIFSFSRESILKLKARTNNRKSNDYYFNGGMNAIEIMGKAIHDPMKIADEKMATVIGNWFRNAVATQTEVKDQTEAEISSFQSLSALLWRAVTRARKFPCNKTTTFRMAVNNRHRLEPKLSPTYFGNAIQSIPTYATAGDVLSHDLRWCAKQLNKNVLSHDHVMVRSYIENWERDPRCFPLGNFDGAMLTMGSVKSGPNSGPNSEPIKMAQREEIGRKFMISPHRLSRFSSADFFLSSADFLDRHLKEKISQRKILYLPLFVSSTALGVL